MFVLLLFSIFLTKSRKKMKGDIVLRLMVSFLVPLILLFGFYSLLSYNIFGFYSLALFFLYFLVSYLLLFLRHKNVNLNSIAFFRIFARVSVGILILFLIFILCILLNLKIPFIYEYINF